jgi:hypothetical protein
MSPPSMAPAAGRSLPPAAGAWEWTTPAGAVVFARVDPATGVESVYVGARLVSRSGAGGKPEGHVLAAPPTDVAYRAAAGPTLIVTYVPLLGAFELRANGRVVPPTSTPAQRPSLESERASPRADGSGSSSLAMKVGAALVALAVSGTLVAAGVRGYVRRASAATVTPGGVVVSSNQLVRIHRPAGFKLRDEKRNQSGVRAREQDDCPTPMCTLDASTTIIEHDARDEGFFVIAIKSNGFRLGRDPWLLSNYFHADMHDAAAKTMRDGKTATLVEGARTDEICLGETGAAVATTLNVSDGSTAEMWSCTFLHEGNAYMMGYIVGGKAAGDRDALRAALEATELLGP